MTKLVADLHAKGFKVGLFSSAGNYTKCKMGKKEIQNPGSSGNEVADANLFVNTYKIDYLAYGRGMFTTKTQPSALTSYATMSYALSNALSNAVAAGKNANPVYFSIEDYQPDWINWAPHLANSWATSNFKELGVAKPKKGSKTKAKQTKSELSLESLKNAFVSNAKHYAES